MFSSSELIELVYLLFQKKISNCFARFFFLSHFEAFVDVVTLANRGVSQWERSHTLVQAFASRQQFPSILLVYTISICFFSHRQHQWGSCYFCVLPTMKFSLKQHYFHRNKYNEWQHSLVLLGFPSGVNINEGNAGISISFEVLSIYTLIRGLCSSDRWRTWNAFASPYPSYVVYTYGEHNNRS